MPNVDPTLIQVLGAPTAGAVTALVERITALEARFAEATKVEPLEAEGAVTASMLAAAKASNMSTDEYNRLITRWNQQVKRINERLAK